MWFGTNYAITGRDRFEIGVDRFMDDPRIRVKTATEFLPNTETDKIHPYFDFDFKSNEESCLPNETELHNILFLFLNEILRLDRYKHGALWSSTKRNRQVISEKKGVEYKASVRFYTTGVYSFAPQMQTIVSQMNAILRNDGRLKNIICACHYEKYNSLDETVYSKWRAMVLVGRYKTFNDRVILIKKQNVDDTIYLIQNVSASDELFSLSTDLVAKGIALLKKEKDEKVSQGSQRNHGSSIKTPFLPGHELEGKTPEELITNYIEQVMKRHGIVYNFSKSLDGEAYFIALDTTWCPGIGKEHASNRQYVILNKYGIQFRCYDSDCSSVKYNVERLSQMPMQIQKIFNNNAGEETFKSEYTKRKEQGQIAMQNFDRKITLQLETLLEKKTKNPKLKKN